MSVYASQSDVEPLIKFIDDDASTDLYNSVLDNADAWVDARLLSNSLSIWTTEIIQQEVTNNNETVMEDVEIISPEDKPIPNLLTTAAKYYAASDIILALYNGEDLPSQFDTYFQKAETMIDAYIAQQKEDLAETELKDKNPCRYSVTPTYHTKTRRRRSML